MKSRYLIPALLAAFCVALPVFAAEEPMQPATHQGVTPPANGIQGKRLSEGTIKGFNYFVDVVDGRALFAKMGTKADSTHHIAVMLMDMKAKKPVEGAKATIKCIPANGKPMVWNFQYNAAMQHMGKDVTLQPGLYTIEGTITFRGEKKTFKAKYEATK